MNASPPIYVESAAAVSNVNRRLEVLILAIMKRNTNSHLCYGIESSGIAFSNSYAPQRSCVHRRRWQTTPINRGAPDITRSFQYRRYGDRRE